MTAERTERRGYQTDEQAKSMSHGLGWRLGGVPSGKVAIDRHARQTIDEGSRGKHNMIQIQSFDKLAPFACLGQQFNHPLPDCGVLGAQTIGCLEINEGAGVDNLEMRGVGEGPLQIALPNRFQYGDRFIRIGVRLRSSDSLRQSSHGLFGNGS